MLGSRQRKPPKPLDITSAYISVWRSPILRRVSNYTALQEQWDRKRRELDLTQGMVAERMGISQSSVSDYLNGKMPLGLEAAIKFAQVLEIDLRLIYEGDIPLPSWSWADRVASLSRAERDELLELILNANKGDG